jgi:putative peptide zinc metalloprotease protein
MGVSMVNPDLRRKIKVRMRTDLIVNRQRYGGQSYYIVKDPLGLRYFRFREEELFLLQSLDGRNNLDDVRHAFVEKFRPQRLSVQELEKFVAQLLQAGLATAQTQQAGQRLFERYKKRKREKIKQLFLNILYVKIPLFDPEKLLTRMLPYTRFLFTLPFFAVALAFAVASLMLVLVNWTTFVSKLPSYQEFFTWRNILYMWAALGVIKILHEFGHGISCKRFGGEVHEMGLLFLVLTPCLYCNVTDAWMLPNKWRRAIIGAAGMYVELMIASLFVWIWWYSEPGMLNTLSLSIVFVCSVSTILFNGNPLLRFDGYYILSDLAEIPNLRERSNKYLATIASQLFLGDDAVKDPFIPKKNRWFFAAYAVAAYLYRIFITVAILYFLYTFLRPYKLAAVSWLLAVAAGVTLIVVPVYKTAKALSNKWRSLKVSKLRMALAFPAAAAVAAAAAFCPLPMRIDAPMMLIPKDAEPVFSPLGGMLSQLHVRDGEPVEPGRPLARLEDPGLALLYATRKHDLFLAERTEQSYRGQEGAEAQWRQAQLAARGIEQDLHMLEAELSKLEIRTPAGVSGVVLSPPKPQDRGKYMKAGDRFCEIGDPKRLEAYVVVPQSEIGLLKERLDATGEPVRVWLKVYGHVGPILEGVVERDRISKDEITDLPQALSNKAGGEVQTKTNPDTKREEPAVHSYAVLVDVPNDEGLLQPGVRGLARIDAGYRSIYWRVKRYIQQTLNFRI